MLPGDLQNRRLDSTRTGSLSRFHPYPWFQSSSRGSMQAKERRPIPEIRFALVPEQRQGVSDDDGRRFFESRVSFCVLVFFCVLNACTNASVAKSDWFTISCSPTLLPSSARWQRDGRQCLKSPGARKHVSLRTH